MRALLLAPLLVLGACFTTRPLETPSGKPEVELRTKDLELAKRGVAEEILPRGFQLRSHGETWIRFFRPADDLETKLVARSRLSGTPVYYVTARLVPAGPGLRMVCDIELVANAGTASQKVTDLSRETAAAHELQDVLGQVQARVSLSEYARSILVQEELARTSSDREAPRVWSGAAR